MKAKTLTKRAFSVILCAVMLFSCWVFTAPTADAANDSAGGYDVKLNWKCTNDGSTVSGSSYGGSSGTYVGIRCASNNGTGATTDYVQGYSKISKTSYSFEKTNVGFPVGWTAGLDDDDTFGDTKMEIESLQVRKNGTSTYTTIWDGQGYLFSKTNQFNIGLTYNGTYTRRKGSSNTTDSGNYINGDTDGWIEHMPYRKTGGTLTRSSANLNLDGTNSKTNTITVTSATDQYGVTYATANCGLSISDTYSKTDYMSCGAWSDKKSTYTVTANAHNSSTLKNVNTVTVSGTWNTANTSDTATGLKTVTCSTFTVTDETYPSYWKYYVTNTSNPDSPTLKSQTVNVYYGDEYNCKQNNAYVYVPSVTDHYYTSSKHYTGGSFASDSNFSKWSQSSTSGTTITMGYTESVHTFTDHYTEVSGNDSVHTAYCSCGYGVTTVADSNHTYNSWSRVNDTNHQRTCSKCNHVQTQAHNITNVQYSTSTTKHWKVCTVCSGKVNETDHDWQWVSDGSTSSSTHTKVCSVCGYRDTTSTATHSVGGWKSDSTNHWKECSVCNAKVDNVGHTQGEKQTENVVAPTCTKAGQHDEVFYCTVCNRELSRTTVTDAASGHNTTGQSWQTDATYHWKNCNNGCGTPQDKANHDWNAWVDNGDGTHSKTCKVCGYEVSGEHSNYTPTVHAPTCTEQGYTTYTCDTCGYAYDDNYVAATGHDADKLNTDAIAYESNGTTHWKTCDWCNQAVYKNAENTWVIGTDGHNPVTTKRDATTLVTPATCTTAGVYHHVCSVCASVLTSEYTVTDGGEGKALGHDPELKQNAAPDDRTAGKCYYQC
ncbi:MAG: hypothetical protein IJG23_00575, partial [Clostridia bacterium]|nr:hypothetical protein [Clostridia bacterium]